MSEKIGWRPTTREYDPNDKRPIDLLHPPKNTPKEVLEELWGGDLGKYPTREEKQVEADREKRETELKAKVKARIETDLKNGDIAHLEELIDSVPKYKLSYYLEET